MWAQVKGYILVPGFMAQVQMCMKSHEEPDSSHGEVERFQTGDGERRKPSIKFAKN
jgi:hypothetical protein